MLQDFRENAVKIFKLGGEDKANTLEHAKMQYKLHREEIPHIVRSFGSHHSKNDTYLFSTELMEISLQQYIERNGPLPFQKFIPIFKDIISGKYFFSFPNDHFILKVFGGCSTKKILSIET
jgi:hypothetical protein